MQTVCFVFISAGEVIGGGQGSRGLGDVYERRVALVQASGQAWRVRVGQRLGSDGQRVQRISPTRLTLNMGKNLVVDQLRGCP